MKRSAHATALTAAGTVGVLASLWLAAMVLLDFMSLATLLGVTVYLAGGAAMAFFTAGRIEGWARTALCLIAPLPGATLVWLGLGALGF